MPSPTFMAKEYSFRREQEQIRGSQDKKIGEPEKKTISQRSRKSSRDSKNEEGPPRMAEKKRSIFEEDRYTKK